MPRFSRRRIRGRTQNKVNGPVPHGRITGYEPFSKRLHEGVYDIVSSILVNRNQEKGKEKD